MAGGLQRTRRYNCSVRIVPLFHASATGSAETASYITIAVFIIDAKISLESFVDLTMDFNTIGVFPIEIKLI